MKDPHPVSLWLAQARAGAPCPALDQDLTADVCIVGGGFVGLWTALALKHADPAVEVVLLEARRCGTGASGRNGGFIMSWWSKFPTLEKLVGSEEALRLARATARVPDEIAEFCADHGVGTEVRRAGWAWAASSAAQVGAWEGVVSALEAHGERPFQPLTREQAIERTGSPAMHGGVFEESCATVQPAILAAGLARHALDIGVRVFERSPVTRIDGGPAPVVRTPNGGVRAGHVVLALGAWAGEHVRALRRSLIVVASDMIATAPAADELDARDVSPGLAMSDSRLMVNYFHRTADGRMAFGAGGGGLAFGHRVPAGYSGPSPIAIEVERRLREMYPGLRAPVELSWRGPVDRSVSGLPYVFWDGERIVGATGFSGNGVGPSRVVARILASMALGLEDEWSRSRLVTRPPSGFPREPVRYVGGRLVRRAVARKEAIEDSGGRPGPLTRRLAGLAPAGLVPTQR